MDRLDAIRSFVRVVECGSFAAVAREAGVGQPAISKQVAALEAHLGAQLIRRTSRSMSLTEAGQTFYEASVRMLSEFDAAESLIGSGQSSPAGLIRVAVPPVFGRLHIIPRLAEFSTLYPEIMIELSATNRVPNLIEEGVDLVVHHNSLVDSSLIVRTIALFPFVTVATTDYLKLHGTPTTPEELAQHSCLIYAPLREPRPWRFKIASGPVMHYPKSRFMSADAEHIKAAALAGLGISHGPAWLFSPEIASGAFRVILSDYEVDTIAISALHPAGRRLPTKVRVFIDFLASIFQQGAQP